MKYQKLSLLFLMCFGAVITTSAQQLYDTTAKPKLISKQFSFTEGSSVDKQGNVFFTDQPNNKIWEYSADGKLSVFMQDALRSNGTYFDSNGNLVSCAESRDQLIAISPTKKIKVLANDYNGHRLNGPNDVWAAPNGDLYFTDPYYQRDFWDRQKPDIEGQNVYYLPKGSDKPVMVVSDMEQPNGIVGTPDGKYLYIADIKANKTFKYKISSDGSLTDKHLFVEQGSDGMTLDEKGNVYLTGNGVIVYNPQGIKIAHIKIDEPWTANLCFCGKNKDDLFITASKAIYILHMNVKGVE
ncbi:SMP-30/gluconolactonase/LRE family protein [Mucilaginibacter sp. BT774]|uniref:SMP-30/gluconolactonase/LRE family protein n=1 Tax=Mucilaginibacter sp. BT774 TaxID=3062276 RepID=UPI002676683A|nr:SMP-30/gluconolactonase/LRE family protein [Mucilaginibacter sp. BT774]MDO3625458.1 SMP-30/gluconolactonase/LRE family protein [Mucilaginibacter sp. BT774]